MNKTRLVFKFQYFFKYFDMPNLRLNNLNVFLNTFHMLTSV